MVASAQCPSQRGVDVIVEIVQDYGWWLLAGGKLHLQAVKWRRLHECLSGESGGHPGGIMGLGDAELAQQCHRSCLSKYATPLPRGLQ